MTTPDAIGDAQVVTVADAHAIEHLALDAQAAIARAYDDAVARIAFLAADLEPSTAPGASSEPEVLQAPELVEAPPEQAGPWATSVTEVKAMAEVETAAEVQATADVETTGEVRLTADLQEAAEELLGCTAEADTAEIPRQAA